MKKGYKFESKFLLCECCSSEHQLVVHFEKNEEYKEVTLSYSLIDNLSFFKRVWLGIKYIFGYRSRYGHFGEINN